MIVRSYEAMYKYGYIYKETKVKFKEYFSEIVGSLNEVK